MDFADNIDMRVLRSSQKMSAIFNNTARVSRPLGGKGLFNPFHSSRKMPEPDLSTLSWQERDRLLTARVDQLRTEMGFQISPRDPAVVRINQLAQRVRKASAGIALWQREGIVLPPRVTVLVMDVDVLNAYTYDHDPSKIYLTAPMLRLLEDEDLLTAILAHENAHHLVSQILERQTARPPKQRFGEPIFRDPLVTDVRDAGHPLEQLAVNKSVEDLCDTVFALPVLDALGVNPLAMMRAQAQLLAYEENVGRNSKMEGMQGAVATLGQSHHPTRERLALVREYSLRTPSVTTLAQALKPKVETLRIPDAVSTKKENLDRLYFLMRDCTDIFETWVVHLFEDHHRHLPFLKPWDKKKIGANDRKTLVLIDFLWRSVFATHDFLTENVVGISKKKDPEAKTLSLEAILQAAHVPSEGKEESTERGAKVEEASEIIDAIATFKKNRQMRLAAELGLFWIPQDLTVEERDTVVTPGSLLTIDEQIPSFDFSPEDIVGLFARRILEGPFRAYPTPEEGENSLRSQMLSISVSTKVMAILLQGFRQNLASDLPNHLRTYVAECARKLVINGHFPSFENDFLPWLREFQRRQCQNPTYAGHLGSEAFIFSVALVAALSESANKENAKNRLRLMKEKGFHPAKTHAELFTGKLHLSFGSNQVEIFKFSQEIAAQWPAFGNAILHRQYRMAPKAGERNKCLAAMLEPYGLDRAMETGALDAGKEYHDALTMSSRPFLYIRGATESMADYLLRLEKAPHRFSAASWNKVAAHSIRVLSDMQDLFYFCDRVMGSDPRDDLKWRQSQHPRALAKILEIGLMKFAAESPGLNDGENVKLIDNLIQQVPRSSFRNGAVWAFTTILANLGAQEHRDLISALATRFETEPYEEMLTSLKTELSQEQPYALTQVEAILGAHPWATVDFSFVESNEKIRRIEGKYYADGLKSRLKREFNNARLHEYSENTGGRRGQAVPKGFVRMVDLESDWKYESILGGVFQYATPETIRFSALTTLKETKNYQAPTKNCPVVSKSVEDAEKAAPVVLNANAMVDPMALTECDDFEKTFQNHLAIAQPVPTPLRDRWLRHVILLVESGGSPLTWQRCEQLQAEAFYPDTKEWLGEKAFQKRLAGRVMESLQEARGLLTWISQVFPYYSATRNRMLLEFRSCLSQCDEALALEITQLEHIPGLPTATPTMALLGVGTTVDVFVRILESFEDLDVVECLLDTFGLRPKGKPCWSRDYIEHLLNRKITNLQDETRRLSSNGIRLFFFHLFGGSQGLFSRGNEMALSLLAETLAEYLQPHLPLGIAKEALVEVGYDLFFRAGFPIRVRCEVLAALFEFSIHIKDLTAQAKSETAADLLIRLFSALPGGLRILQGLTYEPQLFSPEIRQHLYKTQDRCAPGSAVAPFRLASAQGNLSLKLGNRRGGGSMAEVIEVTHLDGRKVNGVVGKFGRVDIEMGIENIRRPIDLLGSTLRRFFPSWNPENVQRVLASCQRERDQTHEARSTGMRTTRLIAECLQGQCDTLEKSGLPDEVILENGDRFILPKSLSLGATAEKTYPYFFLMTDLGEGFLTLSKASEMAQSAKKPLPAFLEEQHIMLGPLADRVILLFVNAFLKRTLFFDLHRGNVGAFPLAKLGSQKFVLLDFGSVIWDYPENYLNGLLRVIAHGGLNQWKEVEKDFIDLALGVDPKGVDGKLLGKLQNLLEIVEKNITNKKAGGGTINLLDLTPLIEFLMTDWPIPAAVRDFAEAARKVFREWGEFVSPEGWQAIGKKVYAVVAAKMFDPKSGLQRSEAANKTIETLYASLAASKLQSEARTPDERFALAQKTDAGVLDKILDDDLPEKTEVWLLDDDNGWRVFLLRASCKKATTFRAADRGGTLCQVNLRPSMTGFLRFPTGDAVVIQTFLNWLT